MTDTGPGEGGRLTRRTLVKGGLLAGGLLAGGGAFVLNAPPPAEASDSTINRLIEQAAELAGGSSATVKLQPGTYTLTEPIEPREGVVLEGERDGSTILQVGVEARCAAIQTPEFETLLNSGESGKGPSQFTLRNLTIDGNRAHNSPEAGSIKGNGINIYGRCYRIEDVIVRNCANDGIRTQDGIAPAFTVTTDSIECHYSMIKVHDCGRHGWYHQGPSDCQMDDVLVYKCNLRSEKGIGLWVEGDNVTNGSGGRRFTPNGLQMENVHVFGAAATSKWGMVLDANVSASNCHAEGNAFGQVLVRNPVSWEGGAIYYIASGSNNEGLGIQLGDNGSTEEVPTTAHVTAVQCNIRTILRGFFGVNEQTAAIKWVHCTESLVDVHCPMREVNTGITVAAGSSGQKIESLTSGRLMLNEVGSKFVKGSVAVPAQVAIIRSGTIIGILSYTNANVAEQRLEGCKAVLKGAAEVKGGDTVQPLAQALWGTPSPESEARITVSGRNVETVSTQRAGSKRLMTVSATPTISFEGLGGEGAATIEGTDSAGVIMIKPKGTPSAGTIATIVYTSGRNRKGKVFLSPVSEAAAKRQAEEGGVYVSEEGFTQFKLRVVKALASGETYTYNYLVVE